MVDFLEAKIKRQHTTRFFSGTMQNPVSMHYDTVKSCFLLSLLICLLSADAFTKWAGKSFDLAAQTLCALVWGGVSNEPK